MAQNLVPNYSFEQYDSCPSNYAQIYKAIPWFQPCTQGGNTLTGSSTEFFHRCNSDSFSANVPKNYSGYQIAKNGWGYAGISPYFGNFGFNGREYLEVKLTNSLIEGKKYCIQFYVSLAEKIQTNAIDGMGAYLSNDSILSVDWSILPYQPQVNNPLGNVILDTSSWTLISGEITASGGEKFITIGNFYPDSIITIIPSGANGIYSPSYYYVDNVSVYLCQCDTTPPLAKFNYTSDTLTAIFINLSSNFADYWFWDFGDGYTDTAYNPVHTYDSAGTYTVTHVACYNGCSDTMVGLVHVNGVGILEINNTDFSFQIYPNPAWDKIVFSNKFSGRNIFIKNIFGENIYSGQFEEELNISVLPEGVYLIEIDNDSKIFRAKFVKR